MTDGALVPATVAEALGVRPQSDRPIPEVIAEVVGRRETLVVIDNCEHVVGDAARLTEQLLGGAPGLRVLATSRDPLRVGSETVWRVPSLPVPPPCTGADECRAYGAVELFVDRALAAHPGLLLDDQAMTTIAEVARRLDGLPLAIELAATRVGALDLTSIVEGLNDRFSLLAGGWRTAPARHQTLRAAVAWSYELLRRGRERLVLPPLGLPRQLQPGRRGRRSGAGGNRGGSAPFVPGVQVDGQHRAA